RHASGTLSERLVEKLTGVTVDVTPLRDSGRMRSLGRWLALELGGRHVQGLGEPADGCELQRLTIFATPDADRADAGRGREVRLLQETARTPVAQGRGQDC